MSPTDFTASPACASRAHCLACLAKAPAQGFAWPASCPHGITIEQARHFKSHPPQPALPSLGTMARNAAGAAVDAVASGFERRSQEEANALLVAHCQPCEFYRASDNRCAQCGCYLALKTRLEAWHCPVGKW